MASLFFCYAREDLELTLEIVRAMENAGYSTWYFERDSFPGTSYSQQIKPQIEACKAVILLASEYSADFPQVTRDIEYAHKFQKPIIPLLIDLSYKDFKAKMPVVQEIIGSCVVLPITKADFLQKIPQLIEGLKKLGVQPEREPPLSTQDNVSEIQEHAKRFKDKSHMVFISYSTKDKKIAETVCNGLETNGIKCWISHRDGGGMYSRTISEAIENARLLVLILSRDADRSKHVLSESDAAFEQDIPIIVFRIEDIKPHPALAYYIRVFHWMDAFKRPVVNYLDDLVKEVQRQLGITQSKILSSNGDVPKSQSEIAKDASSKVKREHRSLLSKMILKPSRAKKLTPRQRIIWIVAFIAILFFVFTVYSVSRLFPRSFEADVLVKYSLVGSPMSGVTIDEVVVTPSRVTLRGPRDVLMRTGSVNAQPISISGLSDDIYYPTVGLVHPDETIEMSKKTVSIQIHIKKDKQVNMNQDMEED